VQRHLAWLFVLAVLATCSCRELIGVDEASLDPGPENTGDGAGGQAGAEG